MSVEYWDLLGGSTVTTAIAGSALASLANNASVLGSSLNNLQGGGVLGGATLCRVTLSWQFGTAPTANTGVSVWLLKNTDGNVGSAFEEGSSSVTPTRPADVVFQVAADTNAHVQSKDILLPAGFVKALLQNNGTGQAFGSTAGNLGLTITPINYQGA
jgi:hypothetical protein